MKITVILERTANNWGAFTPDDVGSIIACGDTRQETLKLFRDALKSHLAAMRADGRDAPDVTELEIRETIPISDPAFEALAA